MHLSPTVPGYMPKTDNYFLFFEIAEERRIIFIFLINHFSDTVSHFGHSGKLVLKV